MPKLKYISATYLLLLFLLTSCASDCPYLRDSPEPTKKMTRCDQVKELTIGSSCRMFIAAEDSETHVGLAVKQNEEYKVEVPDSNQVWKDCTRRSFPLCGEPGSWLMNTFFTKKLPDALWFSVIAEVKPVDDKKSTSYNLCGEKSNRDTARTATFEVVNDGELIMYPNDAEDHYDNNRGKIWLEIQRVK